MALHQRATQSHLSAPPGVWQRGSVCGQPSADGFRIGFRLRRRGVGEARVAGLAAALGELPRHALSREPSSLMRATDARPIGQPNFSSRKPSRPPPHVSASEVVHGAALAAAAVRPYAWPWALGAIVADHLLLAALGLWPRSTLLGAYWTRFPDVAPTRDAVAITIDDGPHPDITPRVLELLEKHGAQATIFCVGEKVRRFPEIARDIVRRGHAIENLSERHVHIFSHMGPRGLVEEVRRAQESIAAVTGLLPRFFRAPAGLRNPYLDPVLARLDLLLACWSRRGGGAGGRGPGAGRGGRAGRRGGGGGRL